VKIVAIVGIALLASGCVSDSQRPHEYWERQLTEIPPGYHEEISLIRLVANPRAYKDHYVRVEGYLHMEFERDKLFLHKDDYEEWLESNSVRIGICGADAVKKLRSLSDHYVFVEGKVWCDKDDDAATLWNITRVERSGLPEIVPLSIDDSGDKQPNKAPLQTPGSGTPAAGAPVAPPPGAAGL
jgi:hypothetical protein